MISTFDQLCQRFRIRPQGHALHPVVLALALSADVLDGMVGDRSPTDWEAVIERIAKAYTAFDKHTQDHLDIHRRERLAVLALTTGILLCLTSEDHRY